MTELRRRNIFLGILGAAVAKSLVMLPDKVFAEAPKEFDRYEELVKRSRDMVDEARILKSQRDILDRDSKEYWDITQRIKDAAVVKGDGILAFMHDNFAAPPAPGTPDFELACAKVKSLLQGKDPDFSNISLLDVDRLRAINETAAPVGLMREFISIHKMHFNPLRMPQLDVFAGRYQEVIIR